MPHDRRREDPARDPAWLLDMLSAAKAVEGFVAGRTLEQYKTDLMLRSAVERQIAIIGEAARNIAQRYRDSHPEIPWNAITIQRHRLVHEYGDIKPDLIWNVATVHVATLVKQLQSLLPPLPGNMP